MSSSPELSALEARDVVKVVDEASSSQGEDTEEALDDALHIAMVNSFVEMRFGRYDNETAREKKLMEIVFWTEKEKATHRAQHESATINTPHMSPWLLYNKYRSLRASVFQEQITNVMTFLREHQESFVCATSDMLHCICDLEEMGVKLPKEPPCPKRGSLDDKIKLLRYKARYACKRREAVRKMMLTAEDIDHARLVSYAIFWKESAAQYTRQLKLYIMRDLHEESMFVDPDVACDTEDDQSVEKMPYPWIDEDYNPGSNGMVITDDESVVESVTPVFEEYESDNEDAKQIGFSSRSDADPMDLDSESNVQFIGERQLPSAKGGSDEELPDVPADINNDQKSIDAPMEEGENAESSQASKIHPSTRSRVDVQRPSLYDLIMKQIKRREERSKHMHEAEDEEPSPAEQKKMRREERRLRRERRGELKLRRERMEREVRQEVRDALEDLGIPNGQPMAIPDNGGKLPETREEKANLNESMANISDDGEAPNGQAGTAFMELMDCDSDTHSRKTVSKKTVTWEPNLSPSTSPTTEFVKRRKEKRAVRWMPEKEIDMDEEMEPEVEALDAVGYDASANSSDFIGKSEKHAANPSDEESDEDSGDQKGEECAIAGQVDQRKGGRVDRQLRRTLDRLRHTPVETFIFELHGERRTKGLPQDLLDEIIGLARQKSFNYLPPKLLGISELFMLFGKERSFFKRAILRLDKLRGSGSTGPDCDSVSWRKAAVTHYHRYQAIFKSILKESFGSASKLETEPDDTVSVTNGKTTGHEENAEDIDHPHSEQSNIVERIYTLYAHYRGERRRQFKAAFKGAIPSQPNPKQASQAARLRMLANELRCLGVQLAEEILMPEPTSKLSRKQVNEKISFLKERSNYAEQQQKALTEGLSKSSSSNLQDKEHYARLDVMFKELQGVCDTHRYYYLGKMGVS